MSQVTGPFKTVRPVGTETFESARTYFERGRKVGVLAAGSEKPYVLRAEFQAKGSSGVENGHYEDTWVSNTQWRREASFGKSRYVRSRNGEKRYELSEGPEAGVLRFVLETLEPIPAIDTFYESDWRIKRDRVGDVRAVRVLAGYESPDGKLDPDQARGYWFDDSGFCSGPIFRASSQIGRILNRSVGLRLPERLTCAKTDCHGFADPHHRCGGGSRRAREHFCFEGA